MKTLFKPGLVLVIIMISIFMSLSTFQLPSPQPLTSDQGEFSAARAMQHVEKIAPVIHPIGSPEQKVARDYIVKELTAMGLKPEIQKGHVENDADFTTGLVPYSGAAENIYVRLEGTEQNNHMILMIAHYDSTLTGPGAADDASGVAALLETARMLLSESPLMNDVIFLFADGEEAELLGSKLFADNFDMLDEVYLVMNFEAMGNKGPSILFETSEGNAWLMNEFKKTVPYPVAFSFTNDIYKITKNVTDFMPFKSAGKNGLNFAILGGAETYHNPQDIPENLSQSSLQHQGSYALSLARHFGNVQLDNVKSRDNAVYFTLMKSVMVFYSGKWILPLTVITLILFLVVLTIGCRKRLLEIKGIIYGFLGSLLMLLTTVGIGIVIQIIFVKLYFNLDNIKELPDLVSTRREIFNNGYWWAPVTMALSVLILFLLQRLFRRRLTACNLFFGNMITWLIFTIVTSFNFQGTGYIFLWPLIFSLSGLLITFIMNKSTALKYLILFVLCTLSCVLLYVPIGYTLFNALSMTAAGIFIPLMSLPTGLIIMTANLLVKAHRQTVN